jgi:hypothetical protein
MTSPRIEELRMIRDELRKRSRRPPQDLPHRVVDDGRFSSGALVRRERQAAVDRRRRGSGTDHPLTSVVEGQIVVRDWSPENV